MRLFAHASDASVASEPDPEPVGDIGADHGNPRGRACDALPRISRRGLRVGAGASADGRALVDAEYGRAGPRDRRGGARARPADAPAYPAGAAQRGLRPGFDPGASDGLFGPRTRA